MQATKELSVSMKQLNALIALCYPLNAAQLISRSCLWLCAFVCLSTLRYLTVPPKHLLYFYSYSLTVKHILSRVGKLTLGEKQTKKKSAKQSSECSTIKWGCRDNKDSFFTLLLPENYSLTQSKKKNVLKTYNYYKYKKEKRSLPLNCREVALVFYDSISRKLNAWISSVDLRDRQSQGGSCFAIHLEISYDGEGLWWACHNSRRSWLI